MSATKVCIGCNEEKPIAEFDLAEPHRVRCGETVRRARCTQCHGRAQETKACIGCAIEKPIEDFNRVHRGSEARQSRCKTCDNEARARGVNTSRRGPRNDRGVVEGPRRKTPMCRVCWNLPHRVNGKACAGCGLARGASA